MPAKTEILQSESTSVSYALHVENFFIDILVEFWNIFCIERNFLSLIIFPITLSLRPPVF